MKRYMPGIDGLRALSVLAVIAYHFNLKWAQGGLLGVGVFFVLSGYLITDQLLMEWKVNKQLSVWNFWVRRFRRLVPAKLSMLILVALWLMATEPTRLLSLTGDFISSIFFVNNWYLIFHEVSYFESFGPVSLIGHLWSLSLEGQFYVIWPIVLFICLRFAPRRGKLLMYILVLAYISAMAMILMHVPGTDPSRVYYGTDTRAFAILIGAALAVGWPSWRLSEKISSSARTSLDIIGVLGLLVLFTLIYRTNEYDDSLYQSGFLFLSLVSAVVIAVLVHPGTRLGKILGCQPLTWLGKHSYSLYIWHYPVIILMRPDASSEGFGFTQVLLQLIIIMVLSVLSYEFIEEPILRGNFRAKWRGIRRHHRFKPMIGLTMTVIAFFIAYSWIINATKVHSKLAQPVSIQNNVPIENQQMTDMSQPFNDDNQQMRHDDEFVDRPNKGVGITLIGDSLTLNVEPYLKELLPGIVVDGKVGRQMSHAQEVVDELRAKGQLGGRIIIELGSNGVFNKSKLKSLLESLPDKQLYLVTTRISRGWQNTVNDAMKEVASEYQNVKIIDWYSASENKNEFFAQDGVHLTPEGAQNYASLLVEHLD